MNIFIVHVVKVIAIPKCKCFTAIYVFINKKNWIKNVFCVVFLFTFLTILNYFAFYSSHKEAFILHFLFLNILPEYCDMPVYCTSAYTYAKAPGRAYQGTVLLTTFHSLDLQKKMKNCTNTRLS